MRKALVCVSVLLALTAVAWLVLPLQSSRRVSDTSRDISGGRAAPVRAAPSLVGTSPGAPSESERAFPDLPPAEVPAGAGVITAGERDLCGRLVGHDGTSIVQGLVAAIDSRTGELLASVSTNRTGRFWLRLPRPVDECRVRASPPSASGTLLVPRVFEGYATGQHDVELTLLEGAWVEGRVVDEGGRGVRAVVRWAGEGLGHQSGEWARTDDDGGFHIAVLPGDCLLVADSRAKGVADSPAVEVRAPASGVRLVCPATRTVTGRILGLGAERAEVFWRVLDSKDEAYTDWEAVNADGSFTIGDLPPGRLVLVADLESGTHCATATIDTRTTTEVELPLVPGLEIAGCVRTTRHPERWMVYARHLQAGVRYGERVDRGGAFRLRGLVAGTYEVSGYLSLTERSIGRRRVEAGTEGVELVVE